VAATLVSELGQVGCGPPAGRGDVIFGSGGQGCHDFSTSPLSEFESKKQKQKRKKGAILCQIRGSTRDQDSIK